MELKERYDQIISEYVRLFEEKQEVYTEGWIGDEVGGLLVVVRVIDYMIDFLDIKYDIDNNIEKGLIFEWMENMLQGNRINYRTYVKLKIKL